MRRPFVSLAAALCFSAAAVSAAAAQDFQKTYRVAPGASVSVKNVSGDVVVTGYDGDAITVTGRREGRDADQVQVEEAGGPNAVELSVRYPRNCNCDASIRFEIQVPRSVRYSFGNLSSASGNIEVRDVSGDVRARTASGNVRVSGVRGAVTAESASGDVDVVDVVGAASARSASGNVEASITEIDGAAANMEFETASGNVHVRLPSSLDADVKMSTMSGDLETDFPIEVHQPKYGPGKRAQGRVGSGTTRLQISSASGNVSLKRQ